MVTVLAGCGGASTSRSDSTALPGNGKPTIVLGSTSSSEDSLVGELYAQALRAMGYIVDFNAGVGDSRQTDMAFDSGKIDAYPEYLGVVATDAGHSAPLTSEAEAEQIAQQYEEARGARVMMPVTPFSSAASLIALASFAQQRNLTTIAELKALPFHVKFGDFAGGETRYSGYLGLQQVYGLTNLDFVTLAADGSIYNALDAHVVQVADASTTDPQLSGTTYAVLSDPNNIFGFQHVALIIRTSLLNRLGPAFQETYASVTKLLTVTVMRALNRAVTIDGEPTESVAHSFLLANHLLTA
jgi:osmoprotectant transport system substrate-binding protein